MPTVDWNLATWDDHYDWSAEGDEWSGPWGSVDGQWHGCVLPRLRHLLPARRILEIAPGHGRWTQYLLGLAEELTIVDISSGCIEACRRRFADRTGLNYIVNDGASLPGVADGSIDLVFSFDSLVHVEHDVVGAYLVELRRVLAADGNAFIHHSNIGEYQEIFDREAALSDEERAHLERERRLPPTHHRSFSMTAERFDQLATEADLHCIGQELIDWTPGRLIDCISVVTVPGSRTDRANRVVRNHWFMAAARSIRAAEVALGPDRA